MSGFSEGFWFGFLLGEMTVDGFGGALFPWEQGIVYPRRKSIPKPLPSLNWRGVPKGVRPRYATTTS